MVPEQTEFICVFFLLNLAASNCWSTQNKYLKVKHGFLNSDPRFHNQFMIHLYIISPQEVL